MRLVGVLVAFALVLDLPMIASASVQNVSPTIEKARPSRARDGQSPLLADCTETVIMPSPLSPRPALRRATYAAKPTRPRRHHARPRRKAPTHRVIHHARHKAVHHRYRHRRPASHRPADRRAILHRVTYASPLCAKRSQVINDMLGLPEYDVTQAPVVADSTSDSVPAFIDVLPVIGPEIGGGGGPTGPGPVIITPIGPILPPGPGPIIIGPPGPPVTPPGPPVTPPVVSSAPEPSSWATMLIGMALVGSGVRKRRRSARKAA